MKPNFEQMSKTELRKYVATHPDDQEAFYALVDRLTAQPSSQVYPASMTPGEIQETILSHIQNKQHSTDT
ncbi:DUF6887 family protein [Gloeothece verrucosa]|uniref:Uncharacterized protein n=1 Tax=Gloeothece verrucosa (strain PCC 7822) TaxID=497965 RepID=E0UGM4_GLOV7|nr:hypothetical protein [Gloeothece verrucosa]ADN13233.1 conserved hypothetical protein [Gloeothece verrucosa PCC 7822]